MKSFNRIPLWKKLLYSKIGLVILLIIAFFVVKATLDVYFNMRKTSARLNEFEKEVARMEARKAELSDELSKLRTEKGAKEEILTKFNVAQVGEGVIIILDPKSPPTTTNVDVKEESFWHFLKFWK